MGRGEEKLKIWGRKPRFKKGDGKVLNVRELNTPLTDYLIDQKHTVQPLNSAHSYIHYLRYNILIVYCSLLIKWQGIKFLVEIGGLIQVSLAVGKKFK